MSAYDTPIPIVTYPQTPIRAGLVLDQAVAGSSVDISGSVYNRMGSFTRATATHGIDADAATGVFTIQDPGSYRVTITLTCQIVNSGGGTADFDMVVAPIKTSDGAASIPAGSVTQDQFPDGYPIEVMADETLRLIEVSSWGVYNNLQRGDRVAVYLASGGGTIDAAEVRQSRGGISITRLHGSQ